MKVALSCDDLLGPSYPADIFEILCEFNQEETAYCLSHHPESVSKTIESRKINSSFLSKKIEGPEDRVKNFYLYPSAAKTLNIGCQYDVILNLSTGFSHGIPKCDTTKQVTILLDFEFKRRKKEYLRERIFEKFLSHWAKKSLLNAQEVWVFSEEMREMVSFHPNVKKVDLFVKHDEYKALKSSSFKYDYVLVSTYGLSIVNAKKLITIFEEQGIKYKFFGKDSHLSDLKKSKEDIRFFGEKSLGEENTLLSGCGYMLSFNKSDFPVHALTTLLCGREVLTLDSDVAKMHLKYSAVELCPDENALFNRLLSKLADVSKEALGPPLNISTKYNACRFKDRLKKTLQGLTTHQ